MNDKSPVEQDTPQGIFCASAVRLHGLYGRFAVLVQQRREAAAITMYMKQIENTRIPIPNDLGQTELETSLLIDYLKNLIITHANSSLLCYSVNSHR